MSHTPWVSSDAWGIFYCLKISQNSEKGYTVNGLFVNVVFPQISKAPVVQNFDFARK